jgi:hypothetical protein
MNERGRHGAWTSRGPGLAAEINTADAWIAGERQSRWAEYARLDRFVRSNGF